MLGGTSTVEEVEGGIIDWGDGYTTTFKNGDDVNDSKFTHTYYDYDPNGTGSTYAQWIIKISGKIGWHIAPDDSPSVLTDDDIRLKLKHVIIPTGKVSPIYDFGTYAFWDANYLQTLPTGLLANCNNIQSLSRCFGYCTMLETIPADLFNNCTQVKNFAVCFTHCGFKSIPSGLFDKCINASDLMECFAYCTNLTSIPENIFDNCTKIKFFDRAFVGCRKVQKLPELWKKFGKYPSNTTYIDCFTGCTQATNYDEALNAYWANAYEETD